MTWVLEHQAMDARIEVDVVPTLGTNWSAKLLVNVEYGVGYVRGDTHSSLALPGDATAQESEEQRERDGAEKPHAVSLPGEVDDGTPCARQRKTFKTVGGDSVIM